MTPAIDTWIFNNAWWVGGVFIIVVIPLVMCGPRFLLAQAKEAAGAVRGRLFRARTKEEAREAARRRHPSSRGRLSRRERSERLSRGERLATEAEFRRITDLAGIGEVLDAVMAETEGWR